MKIKLDLEEKEVNYLIHALSFRPFGEVFELVTKIQRQGQAQIRAVETQTPEKIRIVDNGVVTEMDPGEFKP